MGMQHGMWNRREFLQVGVGAAMIAATDRATAGVLSGRTLYALAAVTAAAPRGVLQSFVVNDRGWRAAQKTCVHAPGHLCVHPTLPIVYASHDVALWDHLPRGAVSAYHLNPTNGFVQLLGTQPLSLGATHPQFATVTADGRSLVALTQSGVYNVLPLAADGSLLPVTAIRKEYGRMTDRASKVAVPMHAVQHGDGSLFAVDSGQETLSRFRLEPDALPVQQRLRVHTGAGARQVALSRCGRWAYALHAQNGSISVHRVAQDAIFPAHQTLHGRVGRASMALSPNGDFLVLAEQGAVSTLPLSRQTGQISAPSSTAVARLQDVAWTPDGAMITGFDTRSGAVTAVAVQAASHTLGTPQTVASIAGCTSIAFCLA